MIMIDSCGTVHANSVVQNNRAVVIAVTCFVTFSVFIFITWYKSVLTEIVCPGRVAASLLHFRAVPTVGIHPDTHGHQQTWGREDGAWLRWLGLVGKSIKVYNKTTFHVFSCLWLLVGWLVVIPRLWNREGDIEMALSVRPSVRPSFRPSVTCVFSVTSQ